VSPEKKTVLFICTHNSGRSQMAEAFLNELFGDQYEASSAGTKPSAINPRVIAVMKETGLDLSTWRAKSVDEFMGQRVDLVITLCDEAQEACPFFPGAPKYDHQGFPDPEKCGGADEQIIACVRRIRDEIREWVRARFEPGNEQPVTRD
jgi:arsenate reductase